ncbi:MAG: hypothetical protein QOE70_1776 [Chthoniobacter sp.]|jgi:hypothetical protein|nr:hypothetical protein [Chthoniobacter sp.]
MKYHSILIAAIFAAFGFLPTAASPKPEKEEFVDLLAQIVPRNLLFEYLDTVNHPEKAEIKDDLEKARQGIERTKINVPKIRKLIRVGASILDYPGLIAYGRIIYNNGMQQFLPKQSEWDYSLYLGVPNDQEGIGKWEFEVVFNERGIITALNNVDRKH